MRTLLVIFCGLLVMNFSLEAKKRTPGSQKTQISKAHRKASKRIVKSRKAPKVHRQRVN